jgi:hypothetical protein
MNLAGGRLRIFNSILRVGQGRPGANQCAKKLNRCPRLRILPTRPKRVPSAGRDSPHKGIALMRTPYRILGLTVLVLAGLTGALSAGKVKAYPGTNVDINGYRTYQWLPPRVMTKTGIVEDHPANPVLKEAVGRELLQRGLSEVADDADLQIQAWILTESIPQLEAVIVAAVGVQPGTYMVVGDPIATIGRYNRQGSLYLNLIDRRTKKSAWFAMVTDSLPNRALKPEQIRAKLDKAAADIFKKYPVKKK